MTTESLAALDLARVAYLRTHAHPSAAAYAHLPSFDDCYERAASFEEVYRSIVERLVAAADLAGEVVYGVPGSPVVAERTVELLRADARVATRVLPAVSFVDLACARLGVDPVSSGLRLVDAARFAEHAAGERGPLLVAQVWSRQVLSDIKLAVEPPPSTTAVLLHHLGLEDEQVVELEWPMIDHVEIVDHLTSLYLPSVAPPVASELVGLVEQVRLARERGRLDPSSSHTLKELAGRLLTVVSEAELAYANGSFDLADCATAARTMLAERL
jgi:tetrapyrrole methylase family protein/MazG family protein